MCLCTCLSALYFLAIYQSIWLSTYLLIPIYPPNYPTKSLLCNLLKLSTLYTDIDIRYKLIYQPIIYLNLLFYFNYWIPVCIFCIPLFLYYYHISVFINFWCLKYLFFIKNVSQFLFNLKNLFFTLIVGTRYFVTFITISKKIINYSWI